MTRDRYETKIRIPVIIKDGQVRPAEGTKFPTLRNGSIGELLVSRYAVESRADRARLLETKVWEVLPSGTSLLVRIDLRESLPDKLEDGIVNGPGVLGPCVKVELREALQLVSRGMRMPSLRPCKCVIPHLDMKARSLNHAYTLISTAFEPWRMSHTGNVFEQVYFERQKLWLPLAALRGG